MKNAGIMAAACLVMLVAALSATARDEVFFGAQKGEKILTTTERTEAKFDEQSKILQNIQKTLEETNRLLKEKEETNKLLQEMLVTQKAQLELFRQISAQKNGTQQPQAQVR